MAASAIAPALALARSPSSLQPGARDQPDDCEARQERKPERDGLDQIGVRRGGEHERYPPWFSIATTLVKSKYTVHPERSLRHANACPSAVEGHPVSSRAYVSS